jgi:dUTP pyrophosphatase
MFEKEEINKIEVLLKNLQKSYGIEDDESEDLTEMNNQMKDLFGIDLQELEDQMMNTSMKFSVKVNKIHEDAVLPKYNYLTDSGFDFHSTEEIEVPPFGRVLVPTGLKFDLPNHMELQVRTKSGLALKHGIMVLNSPGTVDNGYTGEVQVIIFNANNLPFKIEKGMKVAQGVFSQVVSGQIIEFEQVDNINEKDRNANGFGSTGI